MGGDSALSNINPFSSNGKWARAAITGGMSLPLEAALTPVETPKALQTPPPPDPSDPATAEAMSQAEKDQRNARGRASTMLTNPRQGSGLIAKRTLLGV